MPENLTQVQIKQARRRLLLSLTLTLCVCLLLAVSLLAVYYDGFGNMAAAARTRVFRSLPVSWLPEAEGLPVLMYHHLAPQGAYTDEENLNNAAIISVEDFTAQMAYLAGEGYDSIFLSELTQLLRDKEPLPPHTVAISFDDGYESVYRYALPVLRQYGLKADVALIGETADQPAAGAYDPTQLTTLGAAQIAEMLESGLIEFQSHSYALHHIVPLNSRGASGYAGTQRLWLAEQSRPENNEEKAQRLAEDFRLQEELLAGYGITASVIVYPYGVTDRELIAAAKEAGMQSGFTVNTGLVKSSDDIFRLPRLTISQRDDMASFIRKLHYGK